TGDEEIDDLLNADGDELHGGGDEAGVGFWQGFPLVGVNADAVQGLVGGGAVGNFGQAAVAGLATGGENHIRALVKSLGGGGGAPFGVSEGHIHPAGVEGGDDLDVGIGGFGASFVAAGEENHGRDEVGAVHAGDGAAL